MSAVLTDFDVIDKITKLGASKDLEQVKKKEFELWNTWNNNGKKPNDLKPLISSFRRVLRSRANRWVNHVDLPPAAVHAEFYKQFTKALDTYDPEKGTQLGTWVNTNLMKAQRYLVENQNPARIQENRVYKIGMFQNTRATLDQQLGREATTQELSDNLGWSEAEVGRMQSEIRKSVPSSAMGFDPTSMMPDEDVERLKLIRYELSPDELLVYEYLLGYGGKPQLKPGQIARKLGFSPSKVSRIKNSIVAKLQKYGG